MKPNIIPITDDLFLQKFNPEDATNDDWRKHHLFRKKLHMEQTPDDPLSPDHIAEIDLRSIANNTEIKFSMYTIIEKHSKQQVGFATISELTPESESYEDNKHIIQFKIDLLRSHLSRGFYRNVLNVIYHRAVERNKTSLITFSFDSTEVEVLEALGADIAQAGAENRLYINNVDWGIMDRWIKAGLKRSPDSSIKIFTRIPEEIIEEFCKVYTETYNQQPFGSLDINEYIISPAVYRKSERDFSASGSFRYTAVVMEPPSRVNGISEIVYNPADKVMAKQLLTGVRHDHRGKGIGKWLKAGLIKFVVEKHPEIKFITTGNASTNEAMLSINNRMGYKKYREYASIQFRIASQFTQ